MGLFSPTGRTGKVLPKSTPAKAATRRQGPDTSGLITEADLRTMESAGATVIRRAETVTVHTPIGGGWQTDTYTVLGAGQYRIR